MTQTQSIAAALASAVAALALTPLAIRISRSAGWLDQPDGVRKQHRLPVPPCGGIPMFVIVIAGCITMAWAGWSPIPGFLWAAAVIFVSGLIDDLIGLDPWIKLVLQTLAALLAIRSSVAPLHLPGGGVAAMVWLILCANAFNLFDGLDGLAPAAGAIAAIALIFLHGPAGLLTVLSGALLGFLAFNRPPAKVFLGDSGSLTIGFLLGAAALSIAHGNPAALWRPALVLALPLADTVWAAARRMLAGRAVFQADRSHLHHRVLDIAGSPTAALILLSAACFLAAAAAVSLP